MNITTCILHDPKHPNTDVRATSQGGDYPLTTIVRRAFNSKTGYYDGMTTHEGCHSGSGLRTGLVRHCRRIAMNDIKALCV